MRANIYEGLINDRRRFVLVNDDMLLHMFDDPNWGYVGTGPAKVAEAILVNEFGCGVDQALVNDFLEQVVAKWPSRTGWKLTSQEIQEWQENKEDEH